MNKKEINKEEQLELFENVKYRIREEGFYYCFKHYSNWEEIEDKEFHKLRKQFLAVADKMESHVNSSIETLSDELNDFDDL